MNVDVSAVREQEKETNDVPLRVLYEWQKALNVPITELLVEPGDRFRSRSCSGPNWCA